MAADNIELDNLVAGDDVATDLISTRHYQQVKLIDGTIGSETAIASGGGVEAGALRVTIANDSTGTLTVDGTVTANPASGTVDTVTTVGTVSAVTSLDPIVHVENAALGATPSGALAMARQDAALSATGSVDDDATPLTVDANGALWVTPSGTVTVDLGANNDVTLATLPDTAASDLASMSADLGTIDTDTGTIAGAVSGGQMQVDIVADGAGLLTTSAHDAAFGTAGTADAQVRSVQGIAGGTALPVSGTVTANPASGTIDTVTNLAQMGAAAISMNTGVRDAGTQRVTIATNDSVPVTGTVTANPASGTIDTVTTITTANLAAETTKVIGTVRMASGGVASGAFASGALASGAVTDLPLPAGAATSANQDARATGGMSFHMLAMAAADNDAIIKASAATVYFVSIQSIDATPVYLKLFNAASITPGTTAADLQFMAPSQGDANGSGLTLNFGPHGIQFDTGLCALVATGIATDDNTAVSANEVIVTIGYE